MTSADRNTPLRSQRAKAREISSESDYVVASEDQQSEIVCYNQRQAGCQSRRSAAATHKETAASQTVDDAAWQGSEKQQTSFQRKIWTAVKFRDLTPIFSS